MTGMGSRPRRRPQAASRPGPRPHEDARRGRAAGQASLRERAIRVLVETERGHAFSSEILDREPPLDPRDRGLLREIVFGVLRRRRTLDAILRAVSHRPVRDIEPAVAAAIRCGLYQSFFLERVPAHAVVHETVEASRAVSRAAAPFVNACLRGALGAAREIPRGEIPARSSRRVLEAFPRCFLFDRDLFTGPDGGLARHWAERFSYPTFLVRRWIDRVGPAEAERALRAGNERPRMHLRVNRLRATRERARARLLEEGVETAVGDLPGLLVVTGGVEPLRTATFREGWVQVQDASAQRAATLLAPGPGERVLDLCAAPGGKATHLAELLEGRGEVVAVDRTPERLRRVEENARRLGHATIHTVLWEGEGGPPVKGPFSHVLVDAPCTNTGVLARRPEARWRFHEGSLGRMQALQERLLSLALGMLAPGGALVWSVCSVEPEEGPDLLRAAMRRGGNLRIGGETCFLPATPRHDGGYLARLVREA